MLSTVVPPLFAAPSRTPPYEVSPLRLPARSRWPVRLRLLPPGGGFGQPLRGAFREQDGRRFSATRLSVARSLPPTFPRRRVWDMQLSTYRGANKKPLKARGYIRGRISPLPYLTDRSVGIGTWTAASGCRVSSGRFPPPLLIRAGCYSIVVCCGKL